jgi:hypothetical protein
MDEKALVGQAPDYIAGRNKVIFRHDCGGRVDVERPSKDAQALEGGVLRVIEQLATPVDDGPHGGVSVGGIARSAEQAQMIVQSGQEPIDTERTAAGRGQLDGQWHAIEPAADFAALSVKSTVASELSSPS